MPWAIPRKIDIDSNIKMLTKLTGSTQRKAKSESTRVMDKKVFNVNEIKRC